MSKPSEEGQAAIVAEEKIVEQIIVSLESQREDSARKLKSEGTRARELTSELVAATRDEDKQLLASDEAVSHAITHLKAKDVETIEKLIEKPYFARFILAEEFDDGSVKNFEYRLGYAANADCRIIDWRKAPIAKLYYEYKEGDFFSEEILRQERSGTITLRNSVEIERGQLKKLNCRQGTFIKDKGEWVSLSDGGRSRRQSASVNYGQLPEILPLITPEQYALITRDSSSPVLIQGIAGSGKTTVALHRLAWLLHAENSDVTAETCAVIVLSAALQAYTRQTLPSMGIEGVKVYTFENWAKSSLQAYLPQFFDESAKFRRSQQVIPRTILRVKQSLAVLRALETYCTQNNTSSMLLPDLICNVLADARLIMSFDDTRLLDEASINASHAFTIEQFRNNSLHAPDIALLIRALQIRNGTVTLPNGRQGHFKHLVADEIQDLSPVELACIINAVKETNRLTLVGDMAQQTNRDSVFPGWEKLMQAWGIGGSAGEFISLTVSHRSTLPIMQLADHIQQRQLVTQGREGRRPIWFFSRLEERAILAGIKWLQQALQRYPGALTAVLCPDSSTAREAFSMLKNHFGPAIRFCDDSNFSFEEGIIVSSIDKVKGLEFLNVLLWNPAENAYPTGSESQNLLYVAVTRAEENLAIISWQRPSRCLPPIERSSLIRYYSQDLEDEEDKASAS